MTIFSPDHNRKDLEKFPEHIQKDFTSHFVKGIMQAIEIAISEVVAELRKKSGKKVKKSK